MSRRNNLHSFTLWPKASDYVSKVRRGKKSQMVSKAIEWYNEPREFILKEYEYESTVEDGEVGGRIGLEPGTRKYTRNIRMIDLSEFVEANENLQKRFAEVCTELADLKKRRSFISKLRSLFKE